MGKAAQTEKLLTSFGAHCGHTVMTALTLAYALHLQGKPEDDALAAAETAPVGIPSPCVSARLPFCSMRLPPA